MRLKTLHILLPFIFLFFIVLSTIILRMRLLNVPLERDEGEYAYIGRLILDGTPPYTEAYNMKFPGIYFIYAGILWLFGETHIAIHFCLLVVNVISMILLFFLARIAYDDWVAAAAACAFALLSMSYHVQGFWANAEHFILPFVLGAYLLLCAGLRKDRRDFILFSAVLFGCAAVVKQQGAFFGLFGFAVLLSSLWQNKSFDRRKYWKYISAFIGGVVIPLIICFSYLVYAGVLEKFYLWTFAYAKDIQFTCARGGYLVLFLFIFSSSLAAYHTHLEYSRRWADYPLLCATLESIFYFRFGIDHGALWPFQQVSISGRIILSLCCPV